MTYNEKGVASAKQSAGRQRKLDKALAKAVREIVQEYYLGRETASCMGEIARIIKGEMH